jgi:dephospho-CoA kinase
VVAAQMPIEDKRGRAHHVINNSGPLDETRAQVKAVWKQLVVP